MTKPDLYWRRKLRRARAMPPGPARERALWRAHAGLTRLRWRRFARGMQEWMAAVRDRIAPAAIAASRALEELCAALTPLAAPDPAAEETP